MEIEGCCNDLNCNFVVVDAVVGIPLCGCSLLGGNAATAYHLLPSIFVAVFLCGQVGQSPHKPSIVELGSEEHLTVDARPHSLPSYDEGNISDASHAAMNCLPANYVIMRD